MDHRLNLTRLIADLGGAAEVAQLCGVVRTAPYGWVKRRYVSSQVLERLKTAKPDFNLDPYFEVVNDDQDTAGCRIGIPRGGMVNHPDQTGGQAPRDQVDGVPDPSSNRSRGDAVVDTVA
jgi:hypothetical protein